MMANLIFFLVGTGWREGGGEGREGSDSYNMTYCEV